MNILITGGAGYLGSVLVGKLLAANTQIRHTMGTAHVSSAFNSLANEFAFDKLVVYDSLLYRQVCLTDYAYMKNFEFVHGDVRDHRKLLPYIKQADVIIPLAAIVGFPACDKDPKLAQEVNADQIKFILENTTASQHIVFPNTNSGYGLGHGDVMCTEDMPLEPISVYGKTKCEAEQRLLDSGRAITLRLATVFGVSPRMRLDLLVNDFVYKAVNDGYIVLFEKDFKRNFIHIRDVALTFVYMLNQYEKYVGQAFNVGLSNANLSKWELAQEIKRFVPKFSIQVDEFFTDPDKRNYIVCNDKIENTGWRPHYSLQDGIQELINAYSIIQHNNRSFTNL
jgi:nucleoside-diphosphate-sugar epimerase